MSARCQQVVIQIVQALLRHPLSVHASLNLRSRDRYDFAIRTACWHRRPVERDKGVRVQEAGKRDAIVGE